MVGIDLNSTAADLYSAGRGKNACLIANQSTTVDIGLTLRIEGAVVGDGNTLGTGILDGAAIDIAQTALLHMEC